MNPFFVDRLLVDAVTLRVQSMTYRLLVSKIGLNAISGTKSTYR
jgi:hypothetical protein